LLIAAAVFASGAAPPSSKPAPAPTVPAPTPTTINCLIASNLFVQHETDANRRDLARQTLYFYLGRLGERTSQSQLSTSLKDAAEKLKAANSAELMNACVHNLQTRVQLLESAGQQLKGGK
jgi:hypothetical protein